MWCCKCNHDLLECVCSDLKERMASLKKSPYLYFTPEQIKALDKRAEQNKSIQTKSE